MPISLSRLQQCQDKRVKMRFDDDFECIATLVNTSQDFDGNLHLVFDRVEWANNPIDFASSKDAAVYAEGESLISIEEA